MDQLAQYLEINNKQTLVKTNLDLKKHNQEIKKFLLKVSSRSEASLYKKEGEQRKQKTSCKGKILLLDVTHKV